MMKMAKNNNCVDCGKEICLTSTRCRSCANELMRQTNKGRIPWNKGLTRETDERLDKLYKNRTYSKEARRKLSESRRGSIPWNKGKTYEELFGKEKSDYLKNKFSNSSKGIKQSKETIEKRVSKLRGRKTSEETKLKISLANSGKKRTSEAKRKMSETKKRLFREGKIKVSPTCFKKGQIAWNYIDGRSKLLGPRRYGDDWSKIRLVVYARDKFKCKHCGVLMNDYGPLDIHHKIPFLTSFDNSLNNLITLCRSCHMKEDMRMRKQGILEVENGI